METENTVLFSEEHPLTDDVEYKLAVLTKNSQPNSIGVQDYSALMVYCDQHGINAYMKTNTYNGQSSQELTMRWDKEKPVKKEWLIHLGTGTQFAYTNAKPLLQKMGQKQRLLIMWKTYSRDSLYYIFELDKARNAILKLQKICKHY